VPKTLGAVYWSILVALIKQIERTFVAKSDG
jgi:hypothetical protein